jgi:imidazolonepropionase-like amidohydrolase
VSYETGLAAALAAGQATIDHLDSYAEAMLPEGSELAGVAPEWFGLNLAEDMDSGMAAELARQTAEAGVWNVPTQSLFETTSGTVPSAELAARPGMDMLSPQLAERWARAVNDIQSGSPAEARANFLNARRVLISALQAEGAGLLLGSDAPQIMNVPGFSTHQELEYLVAAGLTPLEALQSGTINVAKFFGAEDEGYVAPGAVANLVLLKANPLEDIGNTQAIKGVIRAGNWYDRATIELWFNKIRADGI